ncbi:hypothetical protein LTS10_000643 [Elasticomyces elasticus]|nr:hypothetical protein LTS10_000643 [Elasticomyces elasticus]
MASAKERHPQIYVERNEDPRTRQRTMPMEVLSMGYSRTGTMSTGCKQADGYNLWMRAISRPPSGYKLWHRSQLVVLVDSRKRCLVARLNLLDF